MMSDTNEENIEMLQRDDKADSSEKVFEETGGKIKLFDAIALIYGCIVGSGIFISVSPTFTITESNNILIVLGIWLAGGIVALIGGFMYVELGMRVPLSGGERIFYSTALSPKLSVLFTWIYVYLVKTITLAALAITASDYFVKTVLPDSQGSKLIQTILGISFIMCCMLINSVSSIVATKSGTVLTVVKSVALIIVITSGIVWLAKGHTEDWDRPFKASGFNALSLGVAFINVCWALEGWNSICFMLGEMKNPAKDLPIAMFAGIASVLTFYLLTIMSYSAVLGYGTVRELDTLGIAFSKKVLKKAFPIIPMLVSLSALGALNGNLLAVSRVAMSAGQAGEIPKIFSLVHRKQRTPVFAIVTMSLLSFSFVPMDFQTLLQSLAFVSWLFYFISTICVLKFKFKPEFQPKTKIIQVPIVFVIVFQLVCLFMIGMAFYNQLIGCSVMLGVIFFIYFIQFIPKQYCECKSFSRMHDNMISFFERAFDLVPATLKDVGG